MRELFTLLAAMFLMANVWAQSPPEKMSYQAVIRDGSDVVVTTLVGMKISILQGADNGPSVFEETHTATPNANGLVSIEIGAGTPVLGTIAVIDWSAGPYYIKTQTDPLGGTSYTIDGTAQILSVPYALYSKTAATAGTGTGSLIHYVGEYYQGGIIVSVWKTGGVEHGLIASLEDMSPVVVAWSDVTNVLIGIPASSQIDGIANTAAIVAQSANSAAGLCDAYTNPDEGTGVYSDWYLPAIWELNECYKAALIVNTIVGGVDGFRFDYYWSSTEASATEAYYLGFHTNIFASDALKSYVAGRVRAMRQY